MTFTSFALQFTEFFGLVAESIARESEFQMQFTDTIYLKTEFTEFFKPFTEFLYAFFVIHGISIIDE
jgi:hypothetical protein